MIVHPYDFQIHSNYVSLLQQIKPNETTPKLVKIY